MTQQTARRRDHAGNSPSITNRMIKLVLCLLPLCSADLLARQSSETSQSAPDTEVVAPAIEVKDTRDPFLRPYRIMLKGVAAFEKHRSLASKAELRFILRSQLPELALQDVTLRIAGPDVSIPIPIAENGTFAVPVNEKAAAENADMLLNQKKEAMRWRPYIRTPGLGSDKRRLGDVRLECEVFWAIEQEQQSFFTRNAMNLAGGLCKSSMVRFSYSLHAKLQAATLVSGERHMKLPLAQDGKGFIPPLHDESWNNDAIIELRYVDARNEGRE